MSDSFLSQAIGTVVAAVLAVTAATGVRVPAPAPAPEKQDRPPSGERNPLADKVEPLAKKRDRDARAAEPPAGAYGRDISWPNCPTGLGIPSRRTLGKPMPPPSTTYVIIGLTNGPAFYPNPCLREQVAYARQQHFWTSAYAVVTYPTPSQLRRYGAAGPRAGTGRTGQLWNTGWAQAQMNISNMRAAGLETPALWLDVETVRPPAPWSGDPVANRTVVEGSMAAYRRAGYRLGLYSTAYLWRSVVGEVSYRLPEWRAAGPTSEQEALRRCASSPIQGGPAVIGQWSDVDVDYNVLCPGRPAIDVLRDYFAPY